MQKQTDLNKAKEVFQALLEESEISKEAAHLNQVFLKNITEALPQYVFWKDIHSVYLGCNNNFAQLVGLNSPQDIVGKSDKDLTKEISGACPRDKRAWGYSRGVCEWSP